VFRGEWLLIPKYRQPSNNRPPAQSVLHATGERIKWRLEVSLNWMRDAAISADQIAGIRNIAFEFMTALVNSPSWWDDDGFRSKEAGWHRGFFKFGGFRTSSSSEVLYRFYISSWLIIVFLILMALPSMRRLLLPKSRSGPGFPV
jgi:hypothetical protein